jgi:peptidoglycan/LPS O-acetylase OafA/YrhL
LNQRVNAIDGLRAIAMSMVIAQHCGLMPMGWVGVWLFFVISGYVITKGFISEEKHLRRGITAFQRYTGFLRRRLIRIFPVYFLYIIVCGVVSFGIAGKTSMADLYGLLSFTYNWQMIYTDYSKNTSWVALGHLWTLSVEQQFYIFFPLLFLWVSERWRWRLALLLVLVAPIVRWGWLQVNLFFLPTMSDEAYAYLVYAATHCQIDAFLLGALLARYELPLTQNRALPLNCLKVVFAFVVLYMFTYVGVNAQRGDDGIGLVKNILSGIMYGQGRELIVYSVVALLAAGVMLVTVAKVKGTQWLGQRNLVWVGQVSYGGYLFHALILWAYGYFANHSPKDLPISMRLVAFLGVWLVSVTLASISFKYFEQPFSKKCRQWVAI